MSLTVQHFAAIKNYLALVEEGDPTAHTALSVAVANEPATIETDVETLDGLEALAERARKAAAMLTARARHLEAGAASLRTELLSLMGEHGLTTLEGLTRSLRAKTNGGDPGMSIDIPLGKVEGFTYGAPTDEQHPYFTYVTGWRLDRDALKEDLKRGKQFTWARLLGRGKHLVIDPL